MLLKIGMFVKIHRDVFLDNALAIGSLFESDEPGQYN